MCITFIKMSLRMESLEPDVSALSLSLTAALCIGYVQHIGDVPLLMYRRYAAI